MREARSSVEGTVQTHTSADAFGEAYVVAGSSFLGHSNTVDRSIGGASCGTHYGTLRVVLGLLTVVGRCSDQPCVLPRRLALIARNLN